MLLKEYPFITDENIPPLVVSFLRSISIDVFDIKEEGMASTPDTSIIELAIEKARIILTQDSDFGTLFFRENIQPIGIVYIRPGHVRSTDLIKILTILLDKELDVKIPFIIVAELFPEKVKIRVREI
ncbi:DUF5615 family PIN-like protein [Telluribacter sp.]|jgi:predicted nuclease of predicted toxin-antitoxin system|uniref:DUF5615 family PIN-like protein n=1 Tax=Telluribacter sp. TaxID=1978767 RepID=UPI002E13F5E1|nr:DUF5615 family PIN-like protein [Telluribacter sp.]